MPSYYFSILDWFCLKLYQLDWTNISVLLPVIFNSWASFMLNHLLQLLLYSFIRWFVDSLIWLIFTISPIQLRFHRFLFKICFSISKQLLLFDFCSLDKWFLSSISTQAQSCSPSDLKHSSTGGNIYPKSSGANNYRPMAHPSTSIHIYNHVQVPIRW